MNNISETAVQVVVAVVIVSVTSAAFTKAGKVMDAKATKRRAKKAAKQTVHAAL